MTAFIAYAACLHGPAAAWLRRLGSRPAAIVAVLCVVAATNLAVYPRVDALKAERRGSDEDDALITTAMRLLTGARPLYVPTYLGNAPSAGPGWALLVSPLVLCRGYGLLTPLSVAALVWAVGRSGGGEGGTALALLGSLGSIGFWELTVTGSDLFPIGVLFVLLTLLVSRRPIEGAGVSVITAALVFAAASARAAFGWVTAGLALLMWRTRRAGTWLVAGVTAATVAAEAWLWRLDAEGSPVYLLSKLTGLLGAAGVTVTVVSACASMAVATVQVEDDVASWLLGLWMILFVPLALVSVGVLAALGWQVAGWQAAGYVEVAVPALVAYVSLDTARRSGVRQ